MEINCLGMWQVVIVFYILSHLGGIFIKLVTVRQRLKIVLKFLELILVDFYKCQNRCYCNYFDC